MASEITLSEVMISQARLEGKIDALLSQHRDTEKDIQILFERSLIYSTSISSIETRLNGITDDVKELKDDHSATMGKVLSIISVIMVTIGVVFPALARIFV